MDLEEFISEALAQIANGVQKAQGRCSPDGGAWIVPEGSGMPNLPGFTRLEMQDGKHAYMQEISFDIAITAVERSEGGARAGIRVLAVEASLGKSGARESQSASRVQFKVPVVLTGLRLAEREQAAAEAKAQRLVRPRRLAR